MTPVKKENVVFRKVAGETLLVPIRGDIADMKKIYILNSLGEFIWNMINGERSFEDILDAILANYEVTREEAEKDIKEFLDLMAERNLVEVSG